MSSVKLGAIGKAVLFHAEAEDDPGCVAVWTQTDCGRLQREGGRAKDRWPWINEIASPQNELPANCG